MRHSLAKLAMIWIGIFLTQTIVVAQTTKAVGDLPEFKLVGQLKAQGENIVFHDLNGDGIPGLFEGLDGSYYGRAKEDQLRFHRASRRGDLIRYFGKQPSLSESSSFWIPMG